MQSQSFTLKKFALSTLDYVSCRFSGQLGPARPEGNASIEPFLLMLSRDRVRSFSVPSKVDSAADFLHDEDEDVDEPNDDGDGDNQLERKEGQRNDTAARVIDLPRPHPKPAKRKRLASKSTPAPGNSLEILDACLPEEPRDIFLAAAASTTRATVAEKLPVRLRETLFATSNTQCSDGASADSAALPLTARLAPLSQRMRSLLMRGIYARRRAGKTTEVGEKGGRWAERGRPAGFVGAGLAEELCLAVFGRIQSLRAKGVGKQVRSRSMCRPSSIVWLGSFVCCGIQDRIHPTK